MEAGWKPNSMARFFPSIGNGECTVTTLTTKIRFWGGLRSIGGTVVSVQYGDYRVIFDFGMPYNPAEQVLDGTIKLRPGALVDDYLALGLLPPIDGLYGGVGYQPRLSPAPTRDPLGSLSAPTRGWEEMETRRDAKGGSESLPKTAVLISHLHLDHMAMMGLVHPDIPVFMTRDALRLYEALSVVGESVPGERSYSGCEYDETFEHGDIRVTPLQVDHDALGACAYHIETPDGAIVYTGDLRLHGKYPDWTEQFIVKAKEKGFGAVIMEGTTLRSEEELSEEELVAQRELPDGVLTEGDIPVRIKEVLSACAGLGIFNIYHRNVDRIQAMIDAARDAGRVIVFEAETGYLADLFCSGEWKVYQSRMESTSIPKWKQELYTKRGTVSAEDIRSNPARYFLQNSYDHSLELLDMDLWDAVYVHSNGVPLGSFDPAYQNLRRLLDYLRVEYVSIGTSGHAIPRHLKYIAEELNPSVLIPLHSFHPERLTAKGSRQFLPEYGVEYSWGEMLGVGK